MNHALRTLALLSLGGLAPLSSAPEEAPQTIVVTSFYPIYIMALNVVKGVPVVSIQNLTPPFTGCLHDYTLTVGDMKKLANASLLITNGAGMEPFVEKVATQYPKLRVIPLARGIPLIRGDRGAPANPHVWTSVSNAITEVNNLGATMEEFDPVHAPLYRANTSRYVAKLEALRTRMHTKLSPYRGRKIVTFHEAFPYFAQEFGLVIAAVVEREPGSQPSAQELAHTIDLIKKHGIRVIFSEPQYPASAAAAIARETGAHVYVLDPAVTGPDDPDAYLHIMEANLAVLMKALR
jgi:zinc transport system substrate-binding protein